MATINQTTGAISYNPGEQFQGGMGTYNFTSKQYELPTTRDDVKMYNPNGAPTSIPANWTPDSTLGILTSAPKTNSDQPSSSASAPQNAAGQAAMVSTTQSPAQQPDPNQTKAQDLADFYSQSEGLSISTSSILAGIKAGMDPAEAAAQVALSARTNKQTQQAKDDEARIYRENLASENARYSAANTKLKAEREAAVHVGVAQAAQHGMFEDKSSDAVQYGEAIGRQYDNLQLQLDQQAESARAALAAGDAKAYAAINDAMAQTLQTGLAQIAQRQQVENAAKRQQSQFDIGLKNVAADNFKGLLSQDLPAPSDIQTSIADGSITSNPLYIEGIKAGYTPQGITSLIMSSATAQKTKSDLDMAKYKLALDKESIAADKANKANAQMNVIANVVALQGKVAYGSDEYITQGATITGYSPKIMDNATRAQLSGLENITGIVSTFTDSLKTLDNTDPVKNLLAGKLPWSEKVAKYKGQLSQVASVIARNVFGEKGNLSEGDVERVLNGLGAVDSPSVVRNALFGQMLSNVKGSYSSTLSGLISNGYNVSAYVAPYQSLIKKIDETKQAIPSDTTSGPINTKSILDKWFPIPAPK